MRSKKFVEVCNADWNGASDISIVLRKGKQVKLV